ncbi:hypothetical protein DFH27DRAFT_624003 [Peziza echinospora]|nr:hypothetical protein DFH27DRAFT_624003 [Peziza echinospora]
MPKRTRYSIIKSYGGRPNFQASFGLKMTPEDIEEGNTILDALLENDDDEEQEERQSNSNSHQKGASKQTPKPAAAPGKNNSTSTGGGNVVEYAFIGYAEVVEGPGSGSKKA